MNAVCQNSGQEKNRFQWTVADEHIEDKPSDSEETIVIEPDEENKIKPEVELKEETENFVYKADFRGHLQLVSIAHGVPKHSNTVESSQSDCVEQWPVVKSELQTSADGQQVIISWQEDSNQSENNQVYRQLKNMSNNSVDEGYFIKEEPPEDNSQGCTYVHTLPEIYDYSSDGTWETQMGSPSPLSSDSNLSSNMGLLTQAEKKRLYRMRIKEENPAMWSSIKKREAARKREQREKRRQIIFEMQKAMESATLPESPEVVNQRLYLEALKERYPELWGQLVDALPETQLRNDQLYNERSTKSRRNEPKPARMYKDVIEAQKKRLYRQRLREERPEMYERQKARDAYSRSLQRHMLKKRQLAEKNGFDVESFGSNTSEMEKKLTYLQNLQPENSECDESEKPEFPGEVITASNLAVSLTVPAASHANVPSLIPKAEDPSSAEIKFATKSDPSQVCDNNHSEDNYGVSKTSLSDSNISEHDRTKDVPQENGITFPKNLSSACSKQSDMLWFWNDVKANNQYTEQSEAPHIPYTLWRKGPQILTEEERLQKIVKERMHLKEKRRRYRLSMTPEKRTEFLEIERERLKAYRIKKKEVTTEDEVEKVLCLDQ